MLFVLEGQPTAWVHTGNARKAMIAIIEKKIWRKMKELDTVSSLNGGNVGIERDHRQ